MAFVASEELFATTHHVVCGDSRDMTELADESVALVVTSPPYWQLKDYGAPGQIGYDESYEEYVNHLNLVWRECYRVLHPGCRLCVNVGDQFARAAIYGRYKVIPIRTEIIKFCEAIGFDYMGAIVWQKSTTSNPTGGASLMGSFPLPRNGVLALDYEFILLFKKRGVAPKPGAAVRERSRMTTEEWRTYFAGHWRFAGAKQEGHLAMFPEELPRRLIRMFSFVGETVLDPFAGSGTTLAAAKNLARSSVGYEINEAFLSLIRRKLAADQGDILGTRYRWTRRAPEAGGYEARLAALPYRFRDFVGLERRRDPKELRVGSRVDGNVAAPREEYYAVREVAGAAVVRLSGDVWVRLIGVVERAETREAAVAFLQAKTRGRKVFLRFDAEGRDAEGRLWVYLYLADKTFLNAHLIKQGLAAVDVAGEYRHKARFVRYGGGGREAGGWGNCLGVG